MRRRLAAASSPRKTHLKDLCACTRKHSSDLAKFADLRDYTIEAGGKPWARMTEILSAKNPSRSCWCFLRPPSGLSDADTNPKTVNADRKLLHIGVVGTPSGC